MKFHKDVKKELNKIKELLKREKHEVFGFPHEKKLSFSCFYRGILFGVRIHINCLLYKQCVIIAIPIDLSTSILGSISFSIDLKKFLARSRNHPKDEDNLNFYYGIRLAIHRSYRAITSHIRDELKHKLKVLNNELATEKKYMEKKSIWMKNRWKKDYEDSVEAERIGH